MFDPFLNVLDDGTQLLAILGNHDVSHGDAQLRMPGYRRASPPIGGALHMVNSVRDPDQLV